MMLRGPPPRDPLDPLGIRRGQTSEGYATPEEGESGRSRASEAKTAERPPSISVEGILKGGHSPMLTALMELLVSALSLFDGGFIHLT